MVVRQNQFRTKYIDTKNQLADILTKGNFTRDEWNHLLRFFNIMSFSMCSCSHFSNLLSDPIGKQSAMSKRGQEATSSEGSPMAKPRPMIPAKAKPVNLVLRSTWSMRECPPQNLGHRVGPGNVDEGQGIQTGTRKLVQTANPRIEFQIMKYTNHHYMTKVFPFLPKVGNYSRLLNIFDGIFEDKCADMGNVHVFVNESSHSSWTELFGEFGDLQEHKLR